MNTDEIQKILLYPRSSAVQFFFGAKLKGIGLEACFPIKMR